MEFCFSSIEKSAKQRCHSRRSLFLRISSCCCALLYLKRAVHLCVEWIPFILDTSLAVKPYLFLCPSSPRTVSFKHVFFHSRSNNMHNRLASTVSLYIGRCLSRGKKSLSSEMSQTKMPVRLGSLLFNQVSFALITF